MRWKKIRDRGELDTDRLGSCREQRGGFGFSSAQEEGQSPKVVVGSQWRAVERWQGKEKEVECGKPAKEAATNSKVGP